MKFNSEEYKEFMRKHATKLWQNDAHRKSVGPKISAGLLGKKKPGLFWFNNGLINTRAKEMPVGDNWKSGRK